MREIHVAATKGFALKPVESVQLSWTGIVGNREFFLVDIDDRLYSVPKDPVFLSYWTSFDPHAATFTVGRSAESVCTGPIGPAGGTQSFEFDERRVEGWLVPGPWDELFSDIAGRHLRLARSAAPAGGYDVAPVTLQTAGSLAALGDEVDRRPVDPRRFRMNFTLDVGAKPFVEDAWVGRRLIVGEAVLRVGGGVPRCLSVEHRPYDGDRELRVQQQIRKVRGPTSTSSGPAVLFGVYAEVLRPGKVCAGDRVRLGR